MAKVVIVWALYAVLLAASLYVSYFTYQEYTRWQGSGPDLQFNFNKQVVSFTSLWSESQFQKGNQQEKLEFTVDEQENTIKVQRVPNVEILSFQNLDVEIQDIKSIEAIILLSQSHQIYKISSPYFTIVYCAKTKIIVYEKIYISKNQEYLHVDQSGRLWTFTHPNFNIVLVRVYGSEWRGLLHTYRYATKERIQSISDITEGDRTVRLKLLTFSRNYIVFEFNKQNFQLNFQQDIKTHSFSYVTKAIQKMEIKMSEKLIELDNYQTLQSFLYGLTWGRLGKKFQSKSERENEQDYAFQAFDLGKGLIFETNGSYNASSFVSFGQILVPLRTPVFINREDEQKLLPFNEILNKSRSDENLPVVDFKLYGIKSKNLEIIRGRTGLYRLLPDASVHFMTFNKDFFSFYPKDNVNPEQFYVVRIPTGGIALKANQIKGIFEQVPVPDQHQRQLKFGYSKQEVYHQQTTTGMEVVPTIHEAHAVHKGLFIKLHKNRIEVITSLSGKSVLTHYLNKKQQYQYTGSFIENNQVWVFEHKKSYSPIITKYEIFLNSSSPKSMLSIKRKYDINVLGKVTGVQKCIDYFYYFTYVTEENRWGVARIHHALMSNRQALPDHSYSGAFQKMMIIPKIQRNTQFTVTAAEEELLKIEMDISPEVVSNWVELKLKHQFKILPIRIFAFQNEYYIFNIRKLMVNAFDSQMYQIKHKFHQDLLIGASGLTSLVLVLAAVIWKWANRASVAVPQVKKNKKD